MQGRSKWEDEFLFSIGAQSVRHELKSRPEMIHSELNSPSKVTTELEIRSKMNPERVILVVPVRPQPYYFPKEYHEKSSADFFILHL